MCSQPIFNDGRIDVIINNQEGPPTLLRNVFPNQHHWIEFRLVGGPKSPKDAVGAKVFVTANGTRQRGDVLSGGSFASSSDPRVFFGLGDSTTVSSIEIEWPDGLKQKLLPPPMDAIYTVDQVRGITQVFHPEEHVLRSTSASAKHLP